MTVPDETGTTRPLPASRANTNSSPLMPGIWRSTTSGKSSSPSPAGKPRSHPIPPTRSARNPGTPNIFISTQISA